MNQSSEYPELTDRSKIKLTRSLNLGTCILLVAGSVIGSGVFKKIVPMSGLLMNKEYILLAWITAGIITIFGAFTISGYSGITTESGGLYEYFRLTFGNFFSFLFGWSSFLIIGSGGAAAIAFIFSQSINSIVPLPNFLQAYSHVSLFHFIYPFESSGVKALAVLSIILLTILNILGTKKGSRLNNIITAAKITGILLIIVAGLTYHEAVSTPGVITNRATGTHPGMTAFLFAMLSAFWAYDGWYCIGFMTGEIKNPQKNITKAIIGGIGICIALYVLLNAAFMQVLPLATLSQMGENEIAAIRVARVLAGNSGATGIALLIVISTFGALNATIILYPRLYYRMAQEKFFPKKAAYIHPRYRTPYVALIYAMVWSSILVVSGTFDILTDMVIFAEFIFFALMGWGLIKMKRAGKITGRLIAYPLSPIILILFSLLLLINTLIAEPVQSLAGIIFLVLGIPVYYYFKRKNSKELPQNSEAEKA